MSIQYTSSISSISASQLTGFFVDWPNPPSPSTHLELLRNSGRVILAIDDETKQVVGFVTAITDNVLSAYIPFLEVLPSYQRRGIGKELVHRMLSELSDLYMVDLLCDKNLQPFYQSVGMHPAVGMLVRNMHRQSGK